MNKNIIASVKCVGWGFLNYGYSDVVIKISDTEIRIDRCGGHPLAKLARKYFTKDIKNQDDNEKAEWSQVSVPKNVADAMVKFHNRPKINPKLSIYHINVSRDRVSLSQREEKIFSKILSDNTETTQRWGLFDAYYTDIIVDGVVAKEKIGVVLIERHESHDILNGKMSGIGKTSILIAVVDGIVYESKEQYRDCFKSSKDNPHNYKGNRIINAKIVKDKNEISVETNRGISILKRKGGDK